MAELKTKTVELAKVVSRNPAVHSGDLVFSGTRVPVDTLVDYLIGGYSIGEFLESRVILRFTAEIWSSPARAFP